MKEKLQKFKEKVKSLWDRFKKMLLSLLAAAVLSCLCYVIYEHRKVIRATLLFATKTLSKCTFKFCKCAFRKKK